MLIKIASDVLFQEVRGETVLLNLKNESYFGLDETGTCFWKLLQENHDFQKIQEMMLHEFDVDPDILNQDLERLILELHKAGLIEISKPESAKK